MNTNSTKHDYIKSFVNKITGVRYNSLRYKNFPKVSLPTGPRQSRIVQAEAKKALAIYQAQEAEAPVEVKKKKGTTLSDALSRYLDTPAFRAMRASTQEKRRYILTALCNSGIPSGPKRGQLVLSEVTRENIKAWLLAREETPSAARNLLVALQHFFSERVGSGLMREQHSPVLGVRLEKRMAKRISKGHYETWTQAHVDAFRAHYGYETMERLAFEIMLLTGMSAADVIRFSRSWVGKDAIIRYQRRKTETKAIPFFSKELRAAIAACPLAPPEDKPFEPILRDQLGRIWYKPGCVPTAKLDDPNWRNQDFSQWFTKACRKAGLPEGISAHGVRKRAACDDCLKKWPNKKLMGKFGWSDPKEVALYTLEAEQELFMLEEAAMDAAD
jgi:hypothetical protein